MSIIGLLVTLAVIGFVLWLINTYLPMDGTIKKIMNIIILIVVVLWLLSVFGLLPAVGGYVPAMHFR